MPFDPAKPTLLSTLVRHYEELVDHVRRRFDDRGMAREVVHDVCVQLLERDEKEDVHTPLALLRKISHDAAVSRYRSDRRRTAWVEAVAELPEVACMAATPMGRHEAEREFQALVDAIATLPPRCQAVFVMHKIHEVPQAQVADRLGISVKTVEKHLRLGLAACRLSRRVALRAGQVLFEVSPARYRPFVVSAGSTDIRVLGTRFNVRRLDDDVRVTLERGRVEVGTSATAQAPVVLLPGQQVDAIGGQLTPLAKVDAATAMAWKDDRLVFERTPLGEAVALLRHYRKAPILLDDPSLASLRLTGVFAAHNADRLLDLLPSILPVAVSRQEDGSVEIQRKSTRK